MTLHETGKQTPVCDPNFDSCPRTDDPPAPLFQRPWDEFVIKRDESGKFRSFTACCGYLTPA